MKKEAMRVVDLVAGFIPPAVYGYFGLAYAFFLQSEWWVQILLVTIPSVIGVVGTLANTYLKHLLEKGKGSPKQIDEPEVGAEEEEN